MYAYNIQYYAIRYGTAFAMGDGRWGRPIYSWIQFANRSKERAQYHTYVVHNTLYCNDKNTNNVMNQNKSIAIPYRTVHSASRGGKSDIIHNIYNTHTHNIQRAWEWYFIPSTKTHTFKRTWAYACTHTQKHARERSRTHTAQNSWISSSWYTIFNWWVNQSKRVNKYTNSE